MDRRHDYWSRKSGQKGHMKTNYEITRVLNNDSKSTTTAKRDKDNKIISHNIINHLKLKVYISGVDEIYTSLIWKEEIVKALKKRKNGKLCGVDGTTADISKADTKTHYLETFFQLFETRNYTSSFKQRSNCINSPKKGYIYIYTMIRSIWFQS